MVQLIFKRYLPSFTSAECKYVSSAELLNFNFVPNILSAFIQNAVVINFDMKYAFGIAKKEIHFTCLQKPSQLTSCRCWVGTSGVG